MKKPNPFPAVFFFYQAGSRYGSKITKFSVKTNLKNDFYALGKHPAFQSKVSKTFWASWIQIPFQKKIFGSA